MTVSIIGSIAILILTLALDLFSKSAVTNLTKGGEDIVIIKNVLTFTYSENTGASFGIFSDKTIVLTIITSVIVIGLIIYYLVTIKKSHPLFKMSLALLISGALGNLYDRITLGYVRDFIDYTFIEKIIGQPFAICNFADLVLIVGTVLLSVYALFFYDKQFKKPTDLTVDNINTDIVNTEAKELNSSIDIITQTPQDNTNNTSLKQEKEKE